MNCELEEVLALQLLVKELMISRVQFFVSSIVVELVQANKNCLVIVYFLIVILIDSQLTHRVSIRKHSESS